MVRGVKHTSIFTTFFIPGLIWSIRSKLLALFRHSVCLKSIPIYSNCKSREFFQHGLVFFTKKKRFRFSKFSNSPTAEAGSRPQTVGTIKWNVSRLSMTLRFSHTETENCLLEQEIPFLTTSTSMTLGGELNIRSNNDAIYEISM